MKYAYRNAVHVVGHQVLVPNFQQIEAAGLPEMGAHWCVWNLVLEGAKLKKPPSNGKWGISGLQDYIPYMEAKNLYLAGGYDGIGVLPMESNGIVGLDTDGLFAVVESHGGQGVEASVVSPEAHEIACQMQDIGCYLELSPSGCGLRGFIAARKSGRAKVVKDGHSVESYSWREDRHDNYLTITGCMVGEGAPLAFVGAQNRLETYLRWSGLLDAHDADVASEKPTATVQKIKEVAGEDFIGYVKRDDAAVLALLLGSLNPSGKYSKLLAGDFSAHGGGDQSPSGALFELLGQLAYITRDAAQIERIVRASGVDQSRFDEKRGKDSFIIYQIKRALKEKDRQYDADQAEKAEEAALKKSKSREFRQRAEILMGGLEGLVTDNGHLIRGSHTLSELLARDQGLLGVLYFDEFAGMPRKTISFHQAFDDPCAPKSVGALEDDDMLAITAYARKKWDFVEEERQKVLGAARRWARATSVNPVIEKLNKFEREWDGKDRLDSWLLDFLGAGSAAEEGSDRQYYLREVGRRFLVAVVARAFEPGMQQDQMLILENSAGGEGKSASVRALARAVDPSCFLEGFSPKEDKDTYMLMRGKLLGDWGELAGFNLHESEWNKTFLTKTQDEYRDPYGALNKMWPRTISFIATTNRNDYLKDSGGKRRYWPVQVGFCDVDGLTREAPQLWGEAVRRYKAGERFWIDKASLEDARFRACCDREQRQRLAVTAYDDLANELADRLVCGLVPYPGCSNVIATEWVAFSVKEMQTLLVRDVLPRGEWMAAAASLKRCGWSNGEQFRLPGNTTGWGLTKERANEIRQMHNESLALESGRRSPELREPPKPTDQQIRAWRKLARSN